MTVKRMDNVGIVVEDIDTATEFFIELGLELHGRVPIEGDWADGVILTVEDINDTVARLGKRGARRRSGPARRHVSALLYRVPRIL